MPLLKADEYIAVKYYDGEPPEIIKKSKWYDIHVGLKTLEPGSWRAFEIPSEHFESARHAFRAYMHKYLGTAGTFRTDKSKESDGIIIIWVKYERASSDE